MTDILQDSLSGELTPLRDRIDHSDAELAPSIVSRVLTAIEIGEIKRRYGAEVVNPDREREVLGVYEDAFEEYGLPRELGTKVGAAIIEVSRAVQIAEISIPVRSS